MMMMMRVMMMMVILVVLMKKILKTIKYHDFWVKFYIGSITTKTNWTPSFRQFSPVFPALWMLSHAMLLVVGGSAQWQRWRHPRPLRFSNTAASTPSRPRALLHNFKSFMSRPEKRKNFPVKVKVSSSLMFSLLKHCWRSAGLSENTSCVLYGAT